VDHEPATDPNRFAQDLFTPLPRRYDFLAEVLSMGQNRRWRRAMVDRIVTGRLSSTGFGGHPRRGSTTGPGLVLDVATGTAGVAIQLARRTPAVVVGVDVTEPMLRRGQENVDHAGVTASVVLVAGRAEQLPFPDGAFDAVTFTYLLRYVDDPAATLRELVRVLCPGGVMASLEFAVPPSQFWRFWWWLFTRLVLPAAAAPAGRGWGRVGRFLGPSISGHYRRYPVDWTVGAWRAAGLDDVGTKFMSLGGGLVMWGRKGYG
jgi:demethylmenaquinone methyltransferase/2-methoxy-6-polyprenyl-1,4-benzoquinol methylase